MWKNSSLPRSKSTNGLRQCLMEGMRTNFNTLTPRKQFLTWECLPRGWWHYLCKTVRSSQTSQALKYWSTATISTLKISFILIQSPTSPIFLFIQLSTPSLMGWIVQPSVVHLAISILQSFRVASTDRWAVTGSEKASEKRRAWEEESKGLRP